MNIEYKIDKAKGKFVKNQNKIYEKDQRVASFRRKIRSRFGKDNIQMAYVLFRSMEGRARVLNAYKQSDKPFYKKPFICLCNTCLCIFRCCCNIKRSKDEEFNQSLLFMQKFKIKVEPAINPEHIYWNNFTTNCCTRLFRRCINFFAFLIIFATTLFLYFQMYTVEGEFHEKYPHLELQKLKPHNASKVITLKMVIADQFNGTTSWGPDYKITEEIGLTYAYCEFMTLVLNRDASKVKFPGKQKIKHCSLIKAAKD